jgi:eukaryotic-like serine/threonine-protein kinase
MNDARACLDEDTVIQFAERSLSDLRRSSAERHLATCAGCGDLLAAAMGALSRTSEHGEADEPASQLPVTDGPAPIAEYALLRPLGEGGMGVIFEARQRATGEHVAMKTVRAQTPGSVPAIRREIHALRRIQHPGVVRILDEGTWQGLPWYTMELIRGATLATHLEAQRAQIDGPAPAATAPILPLLSVFKKICSTLAYLHGRGIVHRDLSPRNVVVREDGRPVLVDFGFTARFAGGLGAESLEAARAPVGTAPYMAPEQIRGEIVDARADMYALGCLLYEALTGRPPFRGSDVSVILERHLKEPPRPPSELAAGVSADLEAIVLRLLAKQPRDRIGYAADVGAALSRLGATDWPGTELSPAQTYVYRPGFAGRQEQFSGLLRCLERVRAGSGQALFIGGESGVGKTRLVAEMAAEAKRRGIAVVVAECTAVSPADDSEDATRVAPPLLGLRPLLQELADRCRAGGRVEELLGAGARVLAEFEAGLSRLPGLEDHPVPLALEDEPAKRRLYAHLRHSLGALARAGPLLIVVDDLQWADPWTIGFLRSLPASFFAEQPILMVGTYRTEELGADLEALVAAQTGQRLERLEGTAVATMVGDMLALDDVPANLVEMLHRESEGNPFFVVEYLRAAVQEGWVGRAPGGQWGVAGVGQAALGGGGTLFVPSSLGDILDRRLRGLSAAARALAEQAAVLGRRLALADLRRATGLADMPLMDGLSELLVRELLEQVSGGQLRFSHDKLRERLYGLLSRERRRFLHAAAAKALEDGNGDDRGGETEAVHQLLDRAETLAHHWQSAGEDLLAYQRNLDAARLATDSHQFARSAAAYERARTIAREAKITVPGEIVERQADACSNAGRHHDALTCLRDRLAGLSGALPRAEILGRCAEVEFRRGETARAREQFEEVMTSLGVKCPRSRRATRWRLLILVARYFLRSLFGRRAIRPLRSDSKSDRVLVRTCLRAVEVFYFSEQAKAVVYNLSGLAIAERMGRSPELAMALHKQGAFFALAGSWRAGWRATERAGELEEVLSPVERAWQWAFRGYALTAMGRGQESEREYARAVALLRSCDCTLSLRRTWGLRSEQFLALGAIDAADACTRTLFHLSEQALDERGRAWATALQAHAACKRGQYARGRSIWEEATGLLVEGRDSNAAVVARSRMALYLLLAGEVDEALPLARSAAEVAARNLMHPTLATDGIFLAAAAVALQRRGRLEPAVRKEVWRARWLRRRLARSRPFSAPLYWAGAGALAVAAGRLRKGRALIAKACVVAERHGLWGELCDVHALAAQILPTDEAAAHRPHLEALRARFSEISLQYQVD